VSQPEATPPVTDGAPAEADLSPQEQDALKVAREGLPPVDPHAKPDGRPSRPEGIPEKFWDAEKGEVRLTELAQSYGELEKKFSAAPPAAEETADEDVEVDPKTGKIAKKTEEAAEEAADNPVTSVIEAARAEFDESGSFTEETSEKLAKAGIPVEVQQVYLAGLEALQEKQTATVHGYVGGADNYNAMAKWAGSNLSDAELDAFNASLGNPALAQNAVIGLFARFQSARPSEGRKLAPVNGAGGDTDTFGSRTELTNAMSDPRYKTDPVYQKQVMEKLARTRAAGVSFNR
jgi:hypothetical protein